MQVRLVADDELVVSGNACDRAVRVRIAHISRRVGVCNRSCEADTLCADFCTALVGVSLNSPSSALCVRDLRIEAVRDLPFTVISDTSRNRAGQRTEGISNGVSERSALAVHMNSNC